MDDRFGETIQDVVRAIKGPQVSLIQQSEFFGYFLDLLAHRYVQVPYQVAVGFPHLIPAKTKETLETLATRLSALLGASDPIQTSSVLAEVVVRLLNGVVTDPISPGHAVVLRGCILRTSNRIQSVHDTALQRDQKEAVMASRRRLALLGVLDCIVLTRLDGFGRGVV